MKYLKIFNSASEYNNYKSSYDFETPGVALCGSNNANPNYDEYDNRIKCKFNVESTESPTKIWSGNGPNPFIIFESMEFDGTKYDNTYLQSNNLTNYTFNTTGTHLVKLETKASQGAGVLGSFGPFFQGCEDLEEISIPNTYNNITANSFMNCTKLKKITLSRNIKTLPSNLFMYCENLEDVDLTHITNIAGSSHFYNCNKLKTIEFNDSINLLPAQVFLFSTIETLKIGQNLTSINSMSFLGCDIKNIIIDQNNSTYDARNDCNAIIETNTNKLVLATKTMKLPTSVTTIGSYAYNGNIEYENLNIPNHITTLAPYALGCKVTNTLSIGNGLTTYDNTSFNAAHFASHIIIDPNNSVLNSNNNCNAIIETSTNKLIAGCKNTIIPNNILEIASLAFDDSDITTINIPNSVTIIGSEAFKGCKLLETVLLPLSLTQISNSCFSGCKKLSNITLPSTVTSIGSSAFYLTNISSITLPSALTTIGSSAFSNTKLTSVTFPSSLTSIGNSAFNNCSDLETVTFNSGGIGISYIGNRAFWGCSKLKSISIPNYDNNGYTQQEIGDYCFSGCTALESVTWPTGASTISSYTFENCTGLTSLEFPSTVNYISNYAFKGCTNLTSITFNNESAPSYTSSAFNNMNINAKIYVPANGIISYKKYWPNTFTGRFEIIPNTVNTWPVKPNTSNPQLFDILYSDSQGNLSYSSSVLDPSENKIPIGLCVATKGFFGEGESARWMSLKYMTTSGPENGTLIASSVSFGNSNYDTNIANISSSCLNGYNYLSDVYEYTSSTLIPSLFDSNGDWNLTELGAKNQYAVTCVNGKENSLILTDEVAVLPPKWRTQTIASNTSGSYAPSACCCWRYKPKGTREEDWYLPACGELAIIMAQQNAIDTKLAAINAVYPSDSISSIAYGDYDSSTEGPYSSSYPAGYTNWSISRSGASNGLVSKSSKTSGLIIAMLQY